MVMMGSIAVEDTLTYWLELEKSVASLIDQDLALMRQLLTLNEQIEELKWQRKYSTTNGSGYSSEFSKDSSINASGPYLDSSAYTLGSQFGSQFGSQSDEFGPTTDGSRDMLHDGLSKYPSPSMLSVLSGCEQSVTSLMGLQDTDRPSSDSKTIEGENGGSTSDLGSSTELSNSSNSIKRSKSSAGNSDTLNSTLTNSSQEGEGGVDPDPDPDYETKIHKHEPLMYELQEYQSQIHHQPLSIEHAPSRPESEYIEEYEDRYDIDEQIHDTKAEVLELLGHQKTRSGQSGLRSVSGDLDSCIPVPGEEGDITCFQALQAFDMVLEGCPDDDDGVEEYEEFKSDVVNNNSRDDLACDLEVCIPPPNAETEDELDDEEDPYHEVDDA